MQLNKRLKSKKKKRKVKIEENDTEGEAFKSLNKEQSYEFDTSDAKAMTFNNEKGPLTRSELSESSFEVNSISYIILIFLYLEIKWIFISVAWD